MFPDYSIEFTLIIDNTKTQAVKFSKISTVRHLKQVEFNNEIEAKAVFLAIKEAGIETPTESGIYKIRCDYNYINDQYHIESTTITGATSTNKPFESSTEKPAAALAIACVAALFITSIIYLNT